MSLDVRAPQLNAVDLGRARASDHPDIREGQQYLALIDSEYVTGEFVREHYGWSFDGGMWPAGLQFDAPGTNASPWQALWEIHRPQVDA